MTNAYQDRQDAKRDRLNERAAKLQTEGEAAAKEGFDFFHQLNGQPMLPGHHSYRADVNRRAKNHAKIGRGYDKQNQAKELTRRAAAVGTAGIASDDPQAIERLTAKLAHINDEREQIKKVNGIVRKFAPKQLPGDDFDAQALTEALDTAGIDPALIRAVLKPDFTGRIGIEKWVLENKTAEARRVTKRIAELEALNEATTEPLEWSGDDFEMWVDSVAGRIFLEIEGRLTPDSFAGIRRAGGFNWSRRDRRYVRKVTANAVRAAQQLAPQLPDLIEFEQ